MLFPGCHRGGWMIIRTFRKQHQRQRHDCHDAYRREEQHGDHRCHRRWTGLRSAMSGTLIARHT